MSDDDKPEPAVNPYESPRVPADEPPLLRTPLPAPLDGPYFVLLAVAILLGFISVFPWLAAIFLLLSGPVFLRAFIRSRKEVAAAQRRVLTSVNYGLGTAFLGLAILAASSGAFLGTCTVTAYGTLIPSSLIAYGDTFFERFVPVAMVFSVAMGVVAFGATANWLFRRRW